jgi:hypothetical protein
MERDIRGSNLLPFALPEAGSAIVPLPVL